MLTLAHSGSGRLFYATRESAGFDFCADADLEIAPGTWAVVPTGLRIIESSGVQELPIGSAGTRLSVLPELQIRPRSGLAARHGITVLNTPSTIDADYRGEIKVTLMNHGREPFQVSRGDRIAQGVCALVFQAPDLPVRDQERGEGGFGSTGMN